MSKVVRSVLAYQGSKYRLIPALKYFIPQCDVFHDVFGGSGTVAINMLDIAKIVRYNELDPNVFGILRRLQSAPSPEHISQGLDYHIDKWKLSKSGKNAEKNYYRFQSFYNSEPGPFKLWVLSKHSFSSLMRFNSDGEFNMPWGKRSFARSKARDNKIADWWERFSKVRMSRTTYQKYLKRTAYNKQYMENRFQVFYFDPPYLASGANVYGPKWTVEDEKELLKHLQRLLDSGTKFMLSNVLEHRGHKNNLLKKWIAKNKDKLNVSYPDFSGKGEGYVLNRAADNKNNKTVEVIVTNLCTEI